MKHLLLNTKHSVGFGLGKQEDYKIYLQDDELLILVDDKEISKYKNYEVLTRLFSDAIDIDTWKHSWHLKVSEYLNKDIRDELKKILIEKQIKRRQELKYLEDVERVLMTQKVYVSEPEQLEMPEQ